MELKPGAAGPKPSRTPRALPRWGAALLVAVALATALAAAGTLAAHEIPARVAVRAFVKPEGERLRVLVRVPLEAMRDLDLPLRGPGYLELAELGPQLTDAARLWIAGSLEVYQGGTRLPEPNVAAARLSLPADPSFASYAAALAHVQAAPLPPDTELHWQHALLDVLLEYPITAARDEQFSLRPLFAHLGMRTTTVLLYLPTGGAERAFTFDGNPGIVRLQPQWHHAARSFVELGFRHIAGGFDHLLFVLCLVIPFRRLRPLIGIVTAFTVAHSITLIASALGYAPQALWFPPLIETLIALSIVYMAFENIVGARLQRRWIIAFGFGLVHGFGFSFALRESLQFAGSHLATALFAFNVGVELGQIAVLLVAVPALSVAFRYVVQERIGTILLSALVAHAAWHWLTERATSLRQYRFTLPALDLAFVAAAMRGLMLALIVGGALWLMHGLAGRLMPQAEQKRLEP